MNQVGSAEREKLTAEVETQELLASGENPECQVTGGLGDCLSSSACFAEQIPNLGLEHLK